MTSDWTGFAGARAIDEEEREALAAVLARKTLYRGGGLEAPLEVKRAESELAAALGRKFALMVNSGTSALLAALVAMKIRPGDEVIVPGYGWLTDLSVVLHCGGVPVLAPIGDDLTIDATRLGECTSERTRAIAPVHACGRPYDVSAVSEFARAHHLLVLEDACQGMGGLMDGQPAGHFGDVAALSFQAFKVATSGEGGALVTDNESSYRAAVRFHDAGLLRFADALHESRSTAQTSSHLPAGVGLNLRMSEISAALVRVQLRRLDAIVANLRRARAALLSMVDVAIGTGALLPIPPPTGGSDNGAFLVLRASTPKIARLFHDSWRERGCAVRLAADAHLHALPGWLCYLQSERLPHRVVDLAATSAVLDPTLLVEVNWNQTPQLLSAFDSATREALARI
jgi:8-amino-3,8-dideoxy-alpha-D-manno-octulosonate transaminase